MKPEFVEVNNKRYKINSDFRIALKCDKIAKDLNIGDYERVLAIIFNLFGDEGINDKENHEKLIELAIKYLKCGREENQIISGEENMDFEQDMSYIEASFRSDYNIDLSKENMHWWSFNDLLNGLTENSILNRIRYIRDYDLSEIKDHKEKQKMIKLKKSVELKQKGKSINNKQKESRDKFFELIGLKGE